MKPKKEETTSQSFRNKYSAQFKEHVLELADCQGGEGFRACGDIVGLAGKTLSNWAAV